MADYRADIDLGADVDEVFGYLSDVSNLPRYFHRMTSAAPGDGEEVHVTAVDPDGRTVEGDAWFKVDNEAHTLAWGSEGENDYHGRLHVEEQGLGCRVTVVLSTVRVAGEEIQAGLEQTLANIEGIVVPAG